MSERSTNPDDARPPRAGRSKLADSLAALREATGGLAASNSPPPAPGGGAIPAPAPADDPEARIYFERLEQAGQLADVGDRADLAALPPRVTHVRWPDGTIERIGFSAS